MSHITRVTQQTAQTIWSSKYRSFYRKT